MIETIRQKLENRLEGCHLEVTNMPGGGNHNHLGLIVVSDLFEGLPIFEQHKLVMSTLSQELRGDLHAIQLKTLTFDKYNNLSE